MVLGDGLTEGARGRLAHVTEYLSEVVVVEEIGRQCVRQYKYMSPFHYYYRFIPRNALSDHDKTHAPQLITEL